MNQNSTFYLDLFSKSGKNPCIIKEQAFWGRSLCLSRTFLGEEPVSVSTQAPPPKAFLEHAQTLPNKSPPDVVTVMTQS